MPLTSEQLTLYFNGILVDKTIHNSSLYAQELEEGRIYGLDEHSRRQQEALIILLKQYLQESTSETVPPEDSRLIHQALEQDLMGCAFAIYMGADQAVTFLYFKGCTLPLPPGAPIDEESTATDLFRIFTTTHYSRRGNYTESVPDHKVWLPAYPT